MLKTLHHNFMTIKGACWHHLMRESLQVWESCSNLFKFVTSLECNTRAKTMVSRLLYLCCNISSDVQPPAAVMFNLFILYILIFGFGNNFYKLPGSDAAPRCSYCHTTVTPSDRGNWPHSAAGANWLLTRPCNKAAPPNVPESIWTLCINSGAAEIGSPCADLPENQVYIDCSWRRKRLGSSLQ